jgi:hypothetical protein
MSEVQTLLRSLLGLYSQVSSRLLNSRMSTKRQSGTSREGIPIERLLDEHIGQTEATTTQGSRSSAVADDPAEAPSTRGNESRSALGKGGSVRPGTGLFGALSQYFDRHRSSTQSEPLVREQMRSRTLDHINKALVLAKQGDAERARIHAGLAETAMRTAAEYMSDEEYGEFKGQVETRLRSANAPR